MITVGSQYADQHYAYFGKHHINIYTLGADDGTLVADTLGADPGTLVADGPINGTLIADGTVDGTLVADSNIGGSTIS